MLDSNLTATANLRFTTIISVLCLLNTSGLYSCCNDLCNYNHHHRIGATAAAIGVAISATGIDATAAVTARTTPEPYCVPDANLTATQKCSWLQP